MRGGVREVSQPVAGWTFRLMVDLTSFRQALADLQRQVDELDGIKAGYHEEVLEGEDEVSYLDRKERHELISDLGSRPGKNRIRRPKSA